MPQRIHVPEPDANEQLRVWAEAFADMHYLGDLVNEKASFLLPGEHVEAFRTAWKEARPDFERIIEALSPTASTQTLVPGAQQYEQITIQHLDAAKLSGSQGSQKRSLLARMRDGFLSFFISEPVTEEKLRQAAEEGERYFDFSAVATSSLGACVSEIPGMEATCKALEEGFLGIKHLLGMRSKRGY
jgi:hypothetical protein